MPKRDYLGLRAALADRMLPVLVAAMSFLAALALAGALASATLAATWESQAASALTIQVPQPDQPDPTGRTTRLAAVLAALQATPGIASPKVLDAATEDALLTPWLGAGASELGLQLPGVISAAWTGAGTPDTLATALANISPGTLVDIGAVWAARVAALTNSLLDCALAVLLIVALVAAAVVAVAARAGLAQRRETIAIVHGLGALDGDIANRFAFRATVLAVGGSVLGTVLALPVLAWLAALAAPFSGQAASSALMALPMPLWFAMPALPIAAAGIGWVTAQLTVRGWLRNLP
jgi:cell division transport system permease protein